VLITHSADAASWMDGMRLLHECQLAIRTSDGGQRLTPDEDAASSHCIGYIQGVVDTNALWDAIDKRDHHTNRPHYCVAPNVSLEQIIRVVVEWAKTHPQDLHEPGWVSIQGSLLNAFPCKP
jgi:Rap1a immunity proteins